MKCPECGGTGKVQKYFYEKTDVGKWEKVCGDSPCDECNGTGEIEVTNDEWLDSLTAEEKAEFMAKMVTEAIKEHGKCGATRCESVIWWDEWLKEKHE